MVQSHADSLQGEWGKRGGFFRVQRDDEKERGGDLEGQTHTSSGPTLLPRPSRGLWSTHSSV